MNICILPSAELSYESGSTIYATMLADELVERGHNVSVICSDYPEVANVNVEYIKMDIMKHPVIDDFSVSNEEMVQSIGKIVNGLIKIHNEKQIDVVHCHYATINAIAALNFRLITGVPYVVSCFGRDVFNGSENDRRYAKMCNLSLQHANYIICSNQAVRDKVKTIKYVDSSSIEVLAMPVNHRRFSAKKQKECMEKKSVNLINVVSCMAEEKGLETTIHGLKQLVEDGLDVHLTIIGRDEHPESRNLKNMQQLTEELHITDYVTWAGAVKNIDISACLDKADILIDSRYVGNYSSVILEGLSKHMAVVASDVKGNAEFLKDGAGVLYERGNASDLYQKLKTIILDDLKQTDLEDCAKRWFEKNKETYSLFYHVTKVEEIYASVAKQIE